MKRTLAAGLAALLIAAGVTVLLSPRERPDDSPVASTPQPRTAAAPATPTSAVVATTGIVHLEVFPSPAPGSSVQVRLLRSSPPRAPSPWLLDRELTVRDGLVLDLAPGPWLATASAPGVSSSRMVEVVAGAQHWISLTLEPTRTVTLSVLEKETSAPIANARAELIARHERTGFPTFFAGRYWTATQPGSLSLDGLPSGQVTLRVSAPTHLPAEVPLVDESATVLLEPASWIEGTVRDENGTPIAEATVRAGGLEAAITSATGAFRLATPPGDLVVTALDPAGRSTSARLALAPKATIRGVDLRLGDPLTVSGRVVDALTEEPITGARIVAELPHGGAVVARTVSGALGRFQLDGLPRGWVIMTATLGRGAVGIERSVPTEGGGELLLRLSPAASVTGQVRDETGRPVPDAEVQLTSVSGGELTRTQSNFEGVYQLEDVLPGAVRLGAAAGPDGLSHDERRVLTAGAVLRVDLTLVATGTIEGKVAGSGGPWVVLASSGERPSGGARRVATHADGHFRLVLPRGRWALSLGLPHGAIRFTGSVVTVEAGGTRRVHLDAPAEVTMEDLAAYTEPGTVGLTVEERAGGAVVAWVGPRSPAAAAGLREGDVLVSIDDQPVEGTTDAYRRLRGEPGSLVSVRVRSARGTQVLSLARQRKGPPMPP